MALRLRRMLDFGPEQYEVVFEGRHVGRIYLANPHDKAGFNWYWGINWFERPRETAHHSNLWDGYVDSRDAAMIAFRKAWDARPLS
jgi:hypothetical protein